MKWYIYPDYPDYGLEFYEIQHSVVDIVGCPACDTFEAKEYLITAIETWLETV